MTLNTPQSNFAAGNGVGSKIIRISDGREVALNNLPPADTKRWVVSRKAIVVDAVRKGAVTLGDVCARYSLSEEEIRSWMKLSEKGGSRALRVTRLQDYRRHKTGRGESSGAMA